MTPETEQDRIEREEQEANCDHVLETIKMPAYWENLSTAASCEKCTWAITIHIERVEEL